MNADHRNSIVVFSLIGSMTAGAGVLMWLAPAPVRFGPERLLAASGGGHVSRVRVEYITPGEPADSAAYQCIIMPDGEHSLSAPTSETMYIAVIGSAEDRIPDAQKMKLMQILGSLHQSHGVAVNAMELGEPLVDPAPRQAQDLQAWMAAKGVVRP